MSFSETPYESCITLRTLNYGNYGIFLIRFISSTVRACRHLCDIDLESRRTCSTVPSMELQEHIEERTGNVPNPKP